MSTKTLVVIGIVVGSTAGSFIASAILGGGLFSGIGLFGNLIGGVGGAWLAWRFAS